MSDAIAATSRASAVMMRYGFIFLLGEKSFRLSVASVNVIFEFVSQKIGGFFSVYIDTSGIMSIAENNKGARQGVSQLVDLNIKQWCAVGVGDFGACDGVFHDGEWIRFGEKVVSSFKRCSTL